MRIPLPRGENENILSSRRAIVFECSIVGMNWAYPHVIGGLINLQLSWAKQLEELAPLARDGADGADYDIRVSKLTNSIIDPQAYYLGKISIRFCLSGLSMYSLNLFIAIRKIQ